MGLVLISGSRNLRKVSARGAQAALLRAPQVILVPSHDSEPLESPDGICTAIMSDVLRIFTCYE